jgi:hypothetical protein
MYTLEIASKDPVSRMKSAYRERVPLSIQFQHYYYLLRKLINKLFKGLKFENIVLYNTETQVAFGKSSMLRMEKHKTCQPLMLFLLPLGSSSCSLGANKKS